MAFADAVMRIFSFVLFKFFHCYFRLAASIAAEENGDETNKTSTSGPAILSEEENADDDEEFLLVSFGWT